MALQHLRSSTANKRPLPAGMSDGQLAINTNLASPGLFFKDSAGALVKVGPVHVGTTAPNASPASGGETGNTVGEQWLDTTGGTYVFKVWDGSAWRSESGTFVDVNGDTMTGALGIIAGTAGAPGLFASGDTNTGIYSPGADQLSIATGGTERLRIDSTGQIESVSLGTAAAPAFSFTGDTNTGIYSPGADQVAISTNGAGRLFVVSSGSTGINIASPENTFHVVDTTGISGSIDIGPAANKGRIFVDSTATRIGSVTSHPLVFRVANSEVARFDTSGRLGVGTSSPSDVLHVEGTIRTSSGSSNAQFANNYLRSNQAGTFYFDQNSGSQDFAFRVSNVTNLDTTAMTIKSSGRVGIGSSSPGSPLEVQASGNGGNIANDGIRVYAANRSQYANFGYNGLNATNTLEFGIADSVKMKLDSSGRLGIGTTTVSEKLTVNGTVGVESNLIARGPIEVMNGNYVYLYNSGSSTYWDLRNNSDHLAFRFMGGEKFRCDSSGRLLVGTSSARDKFFNTTYTPQLQLEGVGQQQSFFSLTNSVADNGGPVIGLAKQRSGSIGGNTIVNSGDIVGQIDFFGSDGTEMVALAEISAQVDGTPGANDMPGRLVFSTTPDSGSSPVERLRITNQGRVLVNKTSATSTVSPGIEVTAPNTNLAEFAFEIRDNTNADLIIAASNGNYLRSTTVYARTSANAANITVDSNGYIYRSTSSIKYKTSIETIQPAYSEALLNCRPVWYRSKSERDNPQWGWWGFIAEEVAEIDPRLVQWRTTKTELDENGKFQDVVLDQPEPEGVQYDRFVPHLLNLIKHQKERIEAIEARLTALEQA